MPSNPVPSNWPRLASVLYYDDAHAAIPWLCRAFGFCVRLKVAGPDGSVEHSELVFGDALVLVQSATQGRRVPLPSRSPRALAGAVTQGLCVYVDDVDAHCDAARGAGARILEAPATHCYGPDYPTHRRYRAEDLEGHNWWFMTRVREADVVAG